MALHRKFQLTGTTASMLAIILPDDTVININILGALIFVSFVGTPHHEYKISTKCILNDRNDKIHEN